MRLLILACLLGAPCRYDGSAKPADGVAELLRGSGIPVYGESQIAELTRGEGAAL